MLLPPFVQNGNTDWRVFTPAGVNLSARHQTYIKPPGANWLFILAVGGGGGGGGGQSTAAAARAGGGGGGAGGVMRVLIPTIFLPDTLSVVAGSGGARGASGSGGTNADSSMVSIGATTNSHAVAFGQNGSGGTATGTAGAGGGALSNLQFNTGGLFSYSSGQSGGAGGANTGAAGASITPSTSSFLTGGSGGAGSSTANNVFAGGAQLASHPSTGPACWPQSAGGAAGVSGTTPGGDGQVGVNHGVDIERILSRNQPFLFGGGSGGGSGGASNGGAGRDGAWGCGGGGGGAGAVGGAGGRGGDGFVIIGAF